MNIFVHIRCFDVVSEAVCIGKQQSCVLMPVSPQNVIVMEVIHECLGHLQNAETDVNGLVEQNFLFPHVYECQVIVDAVECFAIGLCHEFF